MERGKQLQLRRRALRYRQRGRQNFLQNVYFGIYADLDAGPRNTPSYFKDDQIGSWSGIWCAPVGGGVEMPERISTVYVYDNDGDGGRTKGYFGMVLLGTQMTMPDGTVEEMLNAPSAIRIFAGLLPYDRGGEPINDFQRYEILSKREVQPNTDSANDYKILVSVGPFFLAPGQSIRLDIAYSAGEGLDEFLDNAAYMKLIYNGTWMDKDGIPIRESWAERRFSSATKSPRNRGYPPISARARRKSRCPLGTRSG